MFRDSFIAAALLAIVMTAGDMIWAALALPHLRMYVIAHGALMCLAFGAVVGWRARRIAPGAVGGLIIGVAAALIFYALAWKLRAVALLPAWMSFWIMFAFLQNWLSGRRDPLHAAIRGLVAAVLSGAVFVAISGIWTRPTMPPNYLVNLGAWTAAYFPGFFVLFWRRPRESRAYR